MTLENLQSSLIAIAPCIIGIILVAVIVAGAVVLNKQADEEPHDEG